MKHKCTTADSQETAALFALGSLSQQEARAFEEHLRDGCPVCESEQTGFDKVTSLLGSSVSPVAPPGYVRDLLALRIDREFSESRPAASVIRFPEQAPRSSTRVSAPFNRALLPWAIAAGLLVVSLISLMMWRSERRAFEAYQNASQSSTENADLRIQIARESARSAELTEIIAVLRSPRWRIISLVGQETASNSSASVYWDVYAKRWVVTADLPPAPEGKVYQLWFVTAEQKISAGLIKPDKFGHGFTMVDLPENLNRLAAAAITLEPEGGSQQPTMPIYALGKA